MGVHSRRTQSPHHAAADVHGYKNLLGSMPASKLVLSSVASRLPRRARGATPRGYNPTERPLLVGASLLELFRPWERIRNPAGIHSTDHARRKLQSALR